jgi:hypothetical protein
MAFYEVAAFAIIVMPYFAIGKALSLPVEQSQSLLEPLMTLAKAILTESRKRKVKELLETDCVRAQETGLTVAA